ncbi:MAG: NlpC/P60 family protein [bacterium]
MSEAAVVELNRSQAEGPVVAVHPGKPLSLPRDAIRAEALSWLRTPYHPGAAVKGAGVDCARLLVSVFEACGIMENPELPEVPADWFLHTGEEVFLQTLPRYAEPVEPPYQEGDILTYQFGRCVSHSALYIGRGELIHVIKGAGVMVERENAPILASRFAGAWRLRCLTS